MAPADPGSSRTLKKVDSMLEFFQPELWKAFRKGYHRADFTSDLSSGILVGVVALPLAMAFAIASGCSPGQGIFTAIIASVIIGSLGGCRLQIAGPTGAFVGLCAEGVTHFGYGGLALATLMAGILLILMGVFRLGRAIQFIPMPVIVGFTTGIAMVILSTQLKDALGLRFDGSGANFLQRLQLVATHLGEWQGSSVSLCTATVLLILAIRRISPALPAALLALVLCTVAATALHLDTATILSRFHQIPHSIPLPSLDAFDLGQHWNFRLLMHRLYELRILAVAIALLGAIESLLSAVVADGMTGDRHHSDTELFAQGVANVVSPFFMGLPVTGAIARTATNIRAGARTPVSSLIHAATLLAIILLAAPLASRIPLPCLAGVLFVVCWNMAELRQWPLLMKTKRSDAFLLPMAFLLTVFVDLTMAVVVGTLLSMLFFVKRMADVTLVDMVTDASETLPRSQIAPGIEIYEVNGPFFFGVASALRDLISRVSGTPTALILHIRHVPFIDGTAVFALRDLHANCRKRGIVLILAGVQSRPLQMLVRSGLALEIGEACIFSDFRTAHAYAAGLAPRRG
jgi:SulP family sulfate permease